MEDSYTVHRRRKAAAKRREKTPEPSSRNQLVETSDDEEEARRARMAKMADDAERAEQEDKDIKLKQEEQQSRESEEKKREESSSRQREEKRLNLEEAIKRVTSHEESSNNSRARENDTEEAITGRSVKKELTSKVDEGSSRKEAPRNEAVPKEKTQDSSTRSKETDVAEAAARTSEPRKPEKRIKKRSKERVAAERYSRSTDSSDMDEKTSESHARRTKSPEGTRIRAKKSSAKRTSEADRKVSSEPDTAKKEAIEKPPREKKSSRKAEDIDAPKRHSRRYSQTDDTDEDPKMKISESFPKRSEEAIRKSSELKKQIIPLSNESLIQDFAKAQREYLIRERSIMEPDPADVFEDAEEETTIRRRRFSVPCPESEEEEKTEIREPEKKRSWFSWLPFFRRKREEKEEEKVEEKAVEEEIVDEEEAPVKVTFIDFLRCLKDIVGEFKAFVNQNPRETRIMKDLRNRCVAELILVIIYCGLGAFVFRFTEGAFESFYKCGVKRVKRDFLDSLWNYSHNLREDDWKSMARRKLMEFEEQLHTAHEAGVHSYSGQRSWTFLNAVVYCLTVITTIGENVGWKKKYEVEMSLL